MGTCEISEKNPLRGNFFQLQERFSVNKPGPQDKSQVIIPTQGTRDCIFLDHGTSDVSPVDIYYLKGGINSPATRTLVRSLHPGEETTYTGLDLITRKIKHKGVPTSHPKDALDANREIAKKAGFEGFK